jgi:hypothetical protein
MPLNIITPCKRPKNLAKVAKSIKQSIPDNDYRWMIIFDCEKGEVPESFIPDNAEVYYHKNQLSIGGNAQRAFALNLIDNNDFIFQLDDDTIMLTKLWRTLKDRKEEFIHFRMYDSTGNFYIEVGTKPELGFLDTGSFVFRKELWNQCTYDDFSDPAQDCKMGIKYFKAAKTSAYIPQPLSIYNALRKNAKHWNGPTFINELQF